MEDTTVTIAAITADRVSNRNAQLTSKLPETIQRMTSTSLGCPNKATWIKAITAKTAASNSAPVVTQRAALSLIQGPNRPAVRAPSSGRNTIAEYIRA